MLALVSICNYHKVIRHSYDRSLVVDRSDRYAEYLVGQGVAICVCDVQQQDLVGWLASNFPYCHVPEGRMAYRGGYQVNENRESHE